MGRAEGGEAVGLLGLGSSALESALRLPRWARAEPRQHSAPPTIAKPRSKRTKKVDFYL